MKRSKKRPLQQLNVDEDLVPIGELKTHISQKIRELRERGRPYIVTQNGKPAAVMLAPDEYDRLNYEVRVLTGIYEGLEDEEAGRFYSDEELSRILEEDEASDSNPSLPKSKKIDGSMD